MADAKPGRRNLITDVEGLRVGLAHDEALLSGVTVVIADEPAVASLDIRGGAPGTRETALLDPTCLVERIDAIVLSGGSVFGLDAPSGVVDWLAAAGRGYRLTAQARPCPIVPAAILFDLDNGGDKDWGDTSPYRALGVEACQAAGRDFALGSAGAGFGALAGSAKGGLGSASLVLENGITVAALFAVNSFGSPVAPDTGRLWAAPFAFPGELNGGGDPRPLPSVTGHGIFAGTKGAGGPGANTTIGIVATDAVLTKAQARRVAIMAQDGLARALRPAHAPVDGDLVFVMATGKMALGEPAALALTGLGAHAADVVARAIGRAVHEARPIAGHTGFSAPRAQE